MFKKCDADTLKVRKDRRGFMQGRGQDSASAEKVAGAGPGDVWLRAWNRRPFASVSIGRGLPGWAPADARGQQRAADFMAMLYAQPSWRAPARAIAESPGLLKRVAAVEPWASAMRAPEKSAPPAPPLPAYAPGTLRSAFLRTAPWVK